MDFNKKLKQIFKQKLYRFILYSLLIHFVIWQKIAQHCKAIIHQLKKKSGSKHDVHYQVVFQKYKQLVHPFSRKY